MSSQQSPRGRKTVGRTTAEGHEGRVIISEVWERLKPALSVCPHVYGALSHVLGELQKCCFSGVFQQPIPSISSSVENGVSG